MLSQQILRTYYTLDSILDSKGSRIGKTNPICPYGAYITVRKADNEQIIQVVVTNALKKNKSRAKKGSNKGAILSRVFWENLAEMTF